METKWHLVENELAQVEQQLLQIVTRGGPEMQEVGSYVLNGKGKRIRPALFLTTVYTSGKDLYGYVDVATALELIHTASLLHDDVIDQASCRRGRDTVHVQWNNKIAVLTGDYFLSQALKILVNYGLWDLLGITVAVVENMADGELQQTFAKISLPDLEKQYYCWIGKKSASFFAGCCQAGSVLRGDNQEQQTRWFEFGFSVGMAFQLIDDMLDYTGNGETTGKPLYSDLKNRVFTLPLIRTIVNEGKKEMILKIMQAEEIAEKDLQKAADLVCSGEGLSYTGQKAAEYIERALAILDKITGIEKEKRESLRSWAEEMLERSRW
ncbi:MAG TPA: polyprenyl synthetase family protein [Firmicutes bacterium]|nr:polyprenyl synthetase family protein [Bacillota bacterium]